MSALATRRSHPVPGDHPLGVPNLLIHGDHDASLLPALAAKSAAQIARNGHLIVDDEPPHGLFVTHIERLNRDIAAFARASAIGSGA